MFQQSKLQIPNFTSFSLSTLSLSLSLSLPLATLKASNNGNCKYPISKKRRESMVVVMVLLLPEMKCACVQTNYKTGTQ
jgi:hypothetical protein